MQQPGAYASGCLIIGVQMKEWLLKKITRSVLVPEFLTGLFVLFLFTVHLFVFGPEGYKNITLVKYISFMSLSVVFILVMLVRMVILRLRKKERCKDGKISFSSVCVIAYMVLTVVSALASEFFPDTIVGAYRREGALTICIYGVIFLLMERNAWSGKWCVYVLGAAAAFYSAVCILQILKVNVFSLFPEGFDYYDAGEKYSGEFLGTMGNAGFAAAFLCLAAPVLLFYIARSNEKERLWLLIPLVFSVFVLLFSRIAAGVLGFAAGIYISLPFVFARGNRRRIWIIAELVLVAAALAVIYAVDFKEGILYEIHSILHGKIEDHFGTSRIFIWRNTLPLLGDRPLLGGGPDTLAQRIGVIFETVKADGSVKRAAIDAAHNEYMHIAVCQGIPAAVVYIAALVGTFVRLLRCRTGDPVAMSLAAGLLSYSVQAFFGISMCIASPYFWVVWALLQRRIRYLEQEAIKETMG